jgi:hypothetical protein
VYGAEGIRNERMDMSHAVVLQVKLLPDENPGDAEKMLKEMVVPMAQAQAGFEKGIWMRSTDNSGIGVVVFDTAEHADAAMSALKPPPGGPELMSSTVYEVGAQA